MLVAVQMFIFAFMFSASYVEVKDQFHAVRCIAAVFIIANTIELAVVN